MYKTVKHEAFISESTWYKSVYDLPGIGAVRGGRLNSAGITTAIQLASLYKRMGRSKFESFLNNTCGRNSRWTGMTIDALDEYNTLQFATVDLDLNTPQKKSSETVINVKKPVEISASSNLPHMESKSESIKEQQESTDELFAKTASLRLNVQKLEENVKELSSGNISKLNELIELPGTVELLKLRIDDFATTISALGDKISSNQRKVIELNANIQNSGELKELSGKIERLQLHLYQTKENGILNKETILREHEHLTKLYETFKCLQLQNVKTSAAINELNGKINSIEDQLVKENIGIRKIIASKNDELENLFEKMNKFERRIKKIEENNIKLNKKLVVMYCLTFLIVITFLLFGR